MFSIIPIPDVDDVISSTTAWTNPILTDLWPVLVVVFAIGLVFVIVRWVAGLFNR